MRHTIGDVFLKMSKEASRARRMNADPRAFDEKMNRHLGEIGRVFAREQGISQNEIATLPRSTPLGQQSEALFRQFSQWLDNTSLTKTS